MEFHSELGIWFKMTRRIPEMGVSDTRVFTSRSRTIRQLEEWLQ